MNEPIPSFRKTVFMLATSMVVIAAFLFLLGDDLFVMGAVVCLTAFLFYLCEAGSTNRLKKYNSASSVVLGVATFMVTKDIFQPYREGTCIYFGPDDMQCFTETFGTPDWMYVAPPIAVLVSVLVFCIAYSVLDLITETWGRLQ